MSVEPVCRKASISLRELRLMTGRNLSCNWQLEPVHGKTILQLSGREHGVRWAPAFRGSDLQENSGDRMSGT
jgi:pulcherriminic acid synthase